MRQLNLINKGTLVVCPDVKSSAVCAVLPKTLEEVIKKMSDISYVDVLTYYRYNNPKYTHFPEMVYELVVESSEDFFDKLVEIANFAKSSLNLPVYLTYHNDRSVSRFVID